MRFDVERKALFGRIAARVLFRDDGCVVWLGAMSQSGWRSVWYPIIRLGSARARSRRLVRVTRLVLILKHGIRDVPPRRRETFDAWLIRANAYYNANGLEASHECDVSKCINEEHLEWQTHADNVTRQAERRAASSAYNR